MAWSNEKLQKLVDHILKIVEEPEKAEENKEAAVRLLQEMLSAMSSVDPSFIDMSSIVDWLKEKRDNLILKKDMGVIEGEITGQLLNYHKRSLNAAKTKIAAMVKSGEHSEEEISNVQAEVRALAGATKEIENYEKGMQKGEAVAEQILASTLGISKNFLGKDGILGSIKGFGKGLKSQLTAGNIAATIALKIFESFMQLDNATTALFQKTGTTGYSRMLVSLRKSLALTYGPDSMTVGAQLLSEVMSARRDFVFMDRTDAERSVYLAGQLSKLGVSVSAFSDLGQFMTLNLGMSMAEQESILNQIYSVGKSQKVSPEKIFREIASTTPVYARYGRQFAEVFTGMSHAAKRTNLDINDLMRLTESLDQTENAYRQAQKFNALLGGNFLNPAALLAADPADKAKLIAQAYQKANQAIGDIHPRVIRSMYKLFGMDANKFKNLVNANFEGFEAELSKSMSMNKEEKFQDKIAKDIEKSKSAGEKVTNALSAFGAVFFEGLFEALQSMIEMIKYVANTMSRYGLFGFTRSTADDITGDSAKRAARHRERERKQGVQSELDFMMMTGDLSDLSPEQMQMISDKLEDRGDFMGSAGLPSTEQLMFAEADRITRLEEERQSQVQRLQRGTRKAKEQRSVDMQSNEVRMGLMMQDSPTPIQMGTSSRENFSTQVPSVDATFETSPQDDVLLSRLIKFRDKLSEYKNKQTRVRLNVGTNVIAEATV